MKSLLHRKTLFNCCTRPELILQICCLERAKHRKKEARSRMSTDHKHWTNCTVVLWSILQELYHIKENMKAINILHLSPAVLFRDNWWISSVILQMASSLLLMEETCNLALLAPYLYIYFTAYQTCWQKGFQTTNIHIVGQDLPLAPTTGEIYSCLKCMVQMNDQC